MDLSTVQMKLKNGEYFVDEEFKKDVDLIWSNALLFNAAGTDVHKMALQMKAEFDRLFTMSLEKLYKKNVKQSNYD